MRLRYTTTVAAAVCVLLAGCGSGENRPPAAPSPSAPGGGFDSVDCNGITDADIADAAGGAEFSPAVVSDAGCFWQENSMFGTVGAGMGISTWWYRGSDMDTERKLEQQAGRTLTELSVDGNKGFKA